MRLLKTVMIILLLPVLFIGAGIAAKEFEEQYEQ